MLWPKRPKRFLLTHTRTGAMIHHASCVNLIQKILIFSYKMRIKPIYSLFLLLYSSMTMTISHQAYIRRCCYQEELFVVFLFLSFLIFFILFLIFLCRSVCVFFECFCIPVFVFHVSIINFMIYKKMTNEILTKIMNVKFSSSGICSSH